MRIGTALFRAAMKTIRIGYWRNSSGAAIKNRRNVCVSSPNRGSTNTNRRPLMSAPFPLPTEPEDIIPSLVKRFNAGDVSNQMAMYAPEAVFIANDGRTTLITQRSLP